MTWIGQNRPPNPDAGIGDGVIAVSGAGLEDEMVIGAVGFSRLTSNTSTTLTRNAYTTGGPHRVRVTSLLTGLRVRVQGGTTGTDATTIRPVISADSSGVPGNPTDAGTEASIAALAAQQTVTLTFASPPTLTPGLYWPGVWAGNASATSTDWAIIRAMNPRTNFRGQTQRYRSSTATYSTSGAPPAPTSMTSGSSGTSELLIEMLLTPVVSAPASITAQADGNGILVRWSAVSGAERYRLERSDDDAAWTTIARTAATLWYDIGITTGATRYYRVRAIYRNAASDPTASTSAAAGPQRATDNATIAALASSTVMENFLSGWHHNGDLGVDRAMQAAYFNYYRLDLSWRDIETAEGVYSWTNVTDAITASAAVNRRIGIRFRCVVPGTTNELPDYIITSGEYDTAGTPSYNVPRWNSFYIRNRIAAFFQAAAAALSSYIGTSIAYIDLNGMYGQYGEMQFTSDVVDARRVDPASAGDWTQPSPNLLALVESQRTAFGPNTPWLMPPGSYDSYATIRYYYRTYPTIGFRADNGGESDDWTLHWSIHSDPETRDLIWEGWRTRMMLMELINAPTDPGEYQYAETDVTTWHVATIHDNNLPSGGYTTLGAAGQTAVTNMALAGGYRYRITNFQTPTSMTRNHPYPITLFWQNDGVAPTYQAWTARIQLRDGGGALVWETNSGVDLRAIWPVSRTTNADWAHQDAIVIPTSVTAASYTLAVQVIGWPFATDAMRLAHGSGENGSARSYWYSLASVSVV